VAALPSLVWDVDPVLFQSESASLRYYSVIFVAELLLGYWLLLKQLRRAGADDEEAGDLSAYVIPAVFIGARLGHVLLYDFGHFARDPWWLFRIWTGGMSSFGAVIGVALAVHLFTKRRAMPWLEATDRLTFSVALAAVLHRLGNLLNSEVPGKATDGTWGFVFPRYDALNQYIDVAELPLRHPTQLYEAFWGVVVLGLLALCDRAWGKEQRPRGALTGTWLIALFSGRFLIELYKQDEPGEPALPFLSMSQLLCALCVAAGLFILWKSLRRRQRAGWTVGG
jgi:prolipoprotein diacylglyceryl transferase